MLRAAGLFFSLLLLTATAGYAETEIVTQYPLQDPDLKTFYEAGVSAGLKGMFQGTGPFTFFVPSNSAIEKYGSAKFQQLQKPENQDALIDFILDHIVPGEYPRTALKPMTIKTVNGKDIRISGDNGEIRINDAKITRPGLKGPNGIVFIIDTVLVP
ncbi:MAG: fasciclin domain-containing protein [Parachlamydia sp.]|nr:fasciclin domain-containing protein [Parachlamydia sp.]